MKSTDLVIIGAGPAGLAAAIYTAREEIATVVLERDVISGGLASQTAIIDNYPGFPEGIAGPELGELLSKQAERFGAQIITGQAVQKLSTDSSGVLVTTPTENYHAKAALITTGNHYKKLGLEREQELTGKGVHYCATCDGPLYSGKHLAVVGGGNSAMQEGLFLTKFATHIDIFVRGDKLKGTELLQERVAKEPKIKIHYNTQITTFNGSPMLQSVTTKNNATGQTQTVVLDGVFIFVGLQPNTDWLGGAVKLDERGFITTDPNYQTSLPGVFAAGDVRSGSTYQIASAVGEAVEASLKIRDFLDSAAPVATDNRQ